MTFCCFSLRAMRPYSYIRRDLIEGFTLVELLVVISIIMLLGALLAPALSRSRAMAQRTKCMSNLRQIGMATQFYVNDYGSYPSAWQSSTSRWMDLIKPYLEKKSYVYWCPSDPVQTTLPWDPDITMSYGMNCYNFGGNDHCFWYGVGDNNVASPSGTILFADCDPGLYYCGGGGVFHDPVNHVAYRHVGGTFCAAFCDGHVDALKITMQANWDASK